MRMTVIVSSYNRPTFIVEALQSIANQTIADDIHVIVADDGSNRETLEAIYGFDGKFGAFTLLEGAPVSPEIRKTTNRVAIKVNAALKYLWSLPIKEQAQYVSYIGDDDLYFTSRCEIMANLLDENPDAFLAYHFLEIHRCDKDGKLLDRAYHLNNPWTPATQWWLENIYNLIDHISFVHRRSNYLWEEDDDFARTSDWGFLKSLIALEENFIHLPQYLAQGRKIVGNSINMDGMAAIKERVAKDGK